MGWWWPGFGQWQLMCGPKRGPSLSWWYSSLSRLYSSLSRLVAKFCLKVTEINPRTWVNLVTSGILFRIGYHWLPSTYLGWHPEVYNQFQVDHCRGIGIGLKFPCWPNIQWAYKKKMFKYLIKHNFVQCKLQQPQYFFNCLVNWLLKKTLVSLGIYLQN